MLTRLATKASHARPSPLQQQRTMATLKEVQLRLKSVKNIGKITKSMKMIAATKLTRAQKAMEIGRVYGMVSESSLKFIEPKTVGNNGADQSEQQQQGKLLVVGCSSDRGLCGAIHSSITKPIKALCRTSAAASNGPQITLAVIGDRGRSQLAREYRQSIAMSFSGIGKNIPTYSEAVSVTDLLLNSVMNGADGADKFSGVKLYFNEFKSMIAYECKAVNLYTADALLNADKLSQYELDDDSDEELLKNYAEFTFANGVFRALVEGHAAEMSARRTAMENATKNSDEVSAKLTMLYNRSRQASITNDLVDIITGASAL